MCTKYPLGRVHSYGVGYSPPGLAFAVNKKLTSNYRFSMSLVQVQILETKRRKEHKWDFEGANHEGERAIFSANE